MIGLPITDPSILVSKEELFDSSIVGISAPASAVKGSSMAVGSQMYSRQACVMENGALYANIITYQETDDIWNYTTYGDYCYIEIGVTDWNNNITEYITWFVINKQGEIVLTKSGDEEKITAAGWIQNRGYVYNLDATLTPEQYWQTYAIFYTCTYTPASEPEKVYTDIKSSLVDAYTKAQADNKFALDTSVSQLWDSSMSGGGGGGSTDLTDYYTKTQIDTSIANNYATKSSVTNIDTSVSQLWDSSTSGGGGVSIQYLTQAQYDALQSKDPNTLYLIEATV